MGGEGRARSSAHVPVALSPCPTSSFLCSLSPCPLSSIPYPHSCAPCPYSQVPRSLVLSLCPLSPCPLFLCFSFPHPRVSHSHVPVSPVPWQVVNAVNCSLFSAMREGFKALKPLWPLFRVPCPTSPFLCPCPSVPSLSSVSRSCPRQVVNAVNCSLFSAVREDFKALKPLLWDAVDEEICLAECDIYRYWGGFWPFL